MSQIYSIVEYYGYQKSSSCGYCKTGQGHSDHGMWLHYLAVQDYQNLIDRGWRRSGSYGYKPILYDACCQMYTIRCEACKVKLSRSQRKLIKRFNRFLVHDERKKCHNKEADTFHEDVNSPNEPVAPSIICKSAVETPMQEEPIVSAGNPTPVTCDTEIKPTEIAAAPKKPTKKKAIRIERAKQRIMGKGKTEEEAIAILKSRKRMPTPAKTIEDLIKEGEKPNAVHRLEMKIVQSSPPNEKFEQTFEEEYNVYKKYQVTIHKDKPEHCTAQQFRRFLVKSPLETQPVGVDNAPVKNFGSYHQQYWLGNKLIAVGVIDILPNCISSVYFFYDPDYSDLVLGTYGSIRELELVRELQKYLPTLQYYYMGFYIHSCPKMRYKARITPSYLLCPEVYTWHSIERCLEKISKYKYCRLNEDTSAEDDNEATVTDNVLVLYTEKILRYADYIKKGGKGNLDELKEYIRVVGKKCAYSMILYRR